MKGIVLDINPIARRYRKAINKQLRELYKYPPGMHPKEDEITKIIDSYADEYKNITGRYPWSLR